MGNRGNGDSMYRARREAAQRLRPLILDDDGDLVYDPRVARGRGVFPTAPYGPSRHARGQPGVVPHVGYLP